ncbi:DUF5391 family protein [Bacillus cytotoxicus]|uniref:YxaJ n=2 Tax=Bacillus cytotoxicus TaxID=580165 RepID=A0AAX2CM33_9BACI|nr:MULTISPECIES: DUF5391 family protein [Bacillus cereus group]ABS23741.1 YxaJ [Bacillus cytotoxicus NVH 391-98]AWC34380.1 hypothetical protein CG482_019675 [Bacillus cytotoxicus]AWC38378.1 hypothetical protein CG481_019525 [Bacillus cytotoxicus]AWC46350.1 hypothetical protein CG479_018855 [Bacillus cytotoxicus]AWC62596.1 hypothetical protein CG474_019245 [Bacillus cytotoxicus]
MRNRSKKSSIVFVTLVSAFFFCSVLVVSSLSPLADFGPNANQFNSLGMWKSIGTILLFYSVPLLLYIAGIRAIRFIMAILCGMGIFINLVILAVVYMIIHTSDYHAYSFLGVIIVCMALIITNIIWFFVAFRSKRNSTYTLNAN